MMEEAASQPSRNKANSEGILEDLSKLEHEQWMHYSKDVSEQIMQANSLEELQLSVKEKWIPNWKNYSALSEEEKDKDRLWARKVLGIIKKHEE